MRRWVGLLRRRVGKVCVTGGGVHRDVGDVGGMVLLVV
jgi:hypothetical protein